MAQPFSLDLRERVVHAYQNTDATLEQVAQRFSVGEATVNRWVSRFRKTGILKPLPWAGGPPALVDEQGLSLLCAMMEDKPDATRDEVADLYQAERGLLPSVATVGRELLRLGFTRKKNVPRHRTGHRAGATSPWGAQRRVPHHRCQAARIHR